jgi:hypothetical protein
MCFHLVRGTIALPGERPPSFFESQDLCYRESLTMCPMSQLTGALDLNDPRIKAWGTPVKAASFVQTEPLISIKTGANHMLIEGPGTSLRMWVSL